MNWQDKVTELLNIVSEVACTEKLGNLMIKLGAIIKYICLKGLFVLVKRFNRPCLDPLVGNNSKGQSTSLL